LRIVGAEDFAEGAFAEAVADLEAADTLDRGERGM